MNERIRIEFETGGGPLPVRSFDESAFGSSEIDCWLRSFPASRSHDATQAA